MLATSVKAVFADVVAVAGHLVVLGILPLGAAIFVGRILVQSLETAPPGQVWSVVAIVVVGLVMMVLARFGLRSAFFQIPRESYRGAGHGRRQ